MELSLPYLNETSLQRRELPVGIRKANYARRFSVRSLRSDPFVLRFQQNGRTTLSKTSRCFRTAAVTGNPVLPLAVTGRHIPEAGLQRTIVGLNDRHTSVIAVTLLRVKIVRPRIARVRIARRKTDHAKIVLAMTVLAITDEDHARMTEAVAVRSGAALRSAAALAIVVESRFVPDNDRHGMTIVREAESDVHPGLAAVQVVHPELAADVHPGRARAQVVLPESVQDLRVVVVAREGRRLHHGAVADCYGVRPWLPDVQRSPARHSRGAPTRGAPAGGADVY